MCRRALVLTLLGLSACATPPPHAVVTVEDPDGLAADALTLAIGTDPTDLTEISLDGQSLPLSVTLTRDDASSEELWFDALDADGNVVGRAWAEIKFSTIRGGGVTVLLGPPCEASADCGDGLYCNGDEICVDRICAPGEEPCPSSPFACVAVDCVELALACDVSVDHSQCEPIALPAGGTEPTYCDTAAGCVRGQGCQESTGVEDCDDGIFCNGVEQCIANRCLAGVPPAVDDANPCTIDFCDELVGEDHIPAPDGNSCELAAPETCTAGTCPGVCVDDQCAGVCIAQICEASQCMDGFHDPLVGFESCDDGNSNDNDTCTNDCTIAICGDGRVFGAANGGFEVCDDGSQCADGTDCTADPSVCVGPDTTCLPRGGDGCRADCMKIEVCGDGELDAGEDCDDGNSDNPNDGCASCRVTVWDALVRFGFGEGGADPLNKSLGEPTMVASDRAGNVFVFEPRWGQIRRVVEDATGSYYVPVAGNGNILLRGEDGPATTATLTVAQGLDVDGLGNLVISDSGANRIMRVNASTGYIERIAGTGENGLAAVGEVPFGDGGPAINARFYLPSGLVIDGQGNIYVADEGNDRIRRIDAETWVVTTIAGKGEVGYDAGGGVALDAGLNGPNDVALDSKGRLVIIDTNNFLIRRVNLETGTIETIAGIPGVESNNGTGDGGPALSAELGTNYGMAIDSRDNIFVTDISADSVRMVDTHGSDDPNDYTIHRVACSMTSSYSDGCGTCLDADCANCPNGLGVALDAHCDHPWGIDVDASDNIYVADEDNNRIRKLSDSDGDGVYSIETIAGNGALIEGDLADSVVLLPRVLQETPGSLGLIIPTGTPSLSDLDLFLADFASHRVMMANNETNVYAHLGGTGEYGYSGDGGPALSASFAYPRSVAPVDNDPGAGTEYIVYVADRDNHCIRRIAPDGTIATIAGTGAPGYNGDGILADAAQLNHPTAVLMDSNGGLLIADSENHRIRRIDFGADPFIAADNVITTVIGDGTPGYNANAIEACYQPLTDCQLNQPRAMFGISLSTISASATGDLIFLADRLNHRVRLYVNGEIDLGAGLIPIVEVVTLAGNGTAGFEPEPDQGGGLSYHDPGTATPLEFPRGLFLSTDPACGTCILVAEGIDRVRALSIAFNPATLGFDTTLDTVLGGPAPEPDGFLATALLRSPAALLGLDDDRWLVADRATGHLRLVDFLADDPATVGVIDGAVNTVVGFPEGLVDYPTAVPAHDRNTFLSPRAFAYDAGHVPPALYVASSRSHTISRVLLADPNDPSTWTAEHVTGTNRQPGHQDGPADDALFSAPSGLAFAATGRILYVAEEDNHTVRAVDVDNPTAANAVTTVAGIPGQLGFFGEDIPAGEAILNAPSGMVFANGLLYLSDTGNNRVRVLEGLDIGDPFISTLLGDGEAASGGFGEPARAFPVNNPVGLVVDSYGNLFAASRNTIRLVTAGADGVARGNDFVQSVYGTVPRDTFPESVTTCLSGLAFNSTEDRIYFLDACLGFFMQLDRRLVNP